MKLNEKIYYCRKKAGLSQEALAALLNVSRQAVSKWETGEAAPEISKVAQLTQVLHVSADWLLSEEDPAEEAAPQSMPPQEEQPAPEARAARQDDMPNWVESIPGVLRRLIRQYGWLAGVRLAVSGGVFTLFGLLMRLVSGAFIGGLSGGTQMQWFDEAGNAVPAPAGLDVSALGMGWDAAGPFSGVTNMASNMFGLMSGFVMLVGVVMLIAGIVIAVKLKRWQDDERR